MKRAVCVTITPSLTLPEVASYFSGFYGLLSVGRSVKHNYFLDHLSLNKTVCKAKRRNCSDSAVYYNL